jgi:hypothetical protein
MSAFFRGPGPSLVDSSLLDGKPAALVSCHLRELGASIPTQRTDPTNQLTGGKSLRCCCMVITGPSFLHEV